MAFEAAPLPHEWMIASIIGFFVSWLLVFEQWGIVSWGIAFMMVFFIMFLASVVSMTNADTGAAHLDVLAIHEKHHKK